MAGFGFTGKWLVLPVKLCVLLLGVYYIFIGVFRLGGMLINGADMALLVNNTATIFGREPSMEFLHQFIESASYPHVEWMVQLHELKLIVMCFAGFLSILAIFGVTRFAAYTLYITTWVYGFVFLITHAGILWCYQQRQLLDFIPSFRSEKGHQVLFFGELTWPSSFWYSYAANLLLNLYLVYVVADLYYSWYLILKAGGSGWEMLPADELPGWDRYQARLNKEREARYNQRHGAPQGGMMPGMMPPGMMPPGMMPPGMMPPGMIPGMPPMGQDITMEEMQAFLNQLQRMQGAQDPGPARFGEVPPQQGIPVRPSVQHRQS